MPRSPFQVLVLPFCKNRYGDFEYVMFERTDEPYWKGIAGGGEEGESPVGAAKREALEEANIPEAARYYQC